MEVNSSTRSRGHGQGIARRRIFTLEHANRTLTFVKRVVADIVKQHRKVGALEERCHMRRPSVSPQEHERVRSQYKAELEKLRELAEELSTVGCRLRDWQRGIVDFRAVFQEREIELCWSLGQEKIEYWHEVDEGFPCRRLIDGDLATELTAAEEAEAVS